MFHISYDQLSGYQTVLPNNQQRQSMAVICMNTYFRMIVLPGIIDELEGPGLLATPSVLVLRQSVNEIIVGHGEQSVKIKIQI